MPFEIPDWLLPADDPPPTDTPGVDPHRVEDLVNRFIAGKQDALFTAPHACYRTTGGGGDGAPGILARLNGLKQATLDAANDDGTRSVLGQRLDAHVDDAGDGIDRHVAAQRHALMRQIISERQRLIQNAAALEHNNDDKLAVLAEAHANATQELAQTNGEPEAPAMDTAARPSGAPPLTNVWPTQRTSGYRSSSSRRMHPRATHSPGRSLTARSSRRVPPTRTKPPPSPARRTPHKSPII